MLEFIDHLRPVEIVGSAFITRQHICEDDGIVLTTFGASVAYIITVMSAQSRLCVKYLTIVSPLYFSILVPWLVLIAGHFLLT